MSTAIKRGPATIDDLLALGEDEPYELIRGSIVEKPQAGSHHSGTQFSLAVRLGGEFQRRPSGSRPGGWWFFTEQLVRFGREAFRPDVCGYRRERMPERPPDTAVLELAPDWVCEILSPGHEAHDRVEKLQTYQRAGVPHYWLMNAAERILEVHRRTDIGYALVLSACSGQRVRAEPFDAVELRVDELFGDDPEEP